MDLRQLECFVAIVDSGGFTRAAEALDMTQPAVSAQVARLERELDARVFDRVGRGGVRLTDAGRAALTPARAALASPDAVRAAVAEVTGLATGRVRLGHVGSGATGTLAGPLVTLHRQHPGVEVSLVEDSSDRLVQQVLAGELDLAWVALAGPTPGGLDCRVVQDDRVVLGVPDGHRWQGRRSVTVSTALAERLVALPVGTGARAALDEAAEAVRVEPRIAYECSAPDLVATLVRAGLGIAVLAEPLALALGLAVVQLTRPVPRSRLLLVWREGGPTSPAARALLATIGRISA